MIRRSSGLKRSSEFETEVLLILSLPAHVSTLVLVLLPFRGSILAKGMRTRTSWIELCACLLVRGPPLRGVPLAVSLLLFRVNTLKGRMLVLRHFLRGVSLTSSPLLFLVNTLDGQMVLPQVPVWEPLVCLRVWSLMLPRILPMSL